MWKDAFRIQTDRYRVRHDTTSTRQDYLLLRRVPAVSQLVPMDFHQGLPDIKNFDGRQFVLLIIHDLMQETDEAVANIFTKSSRHRNISVVFLAQNLFPQNKFSRTVSPNAHYIVLFKNARDASQFANLARQMYPKTSKFAVEACV